MKSINNTLNDKILEISQAVGYRVNTDGSRNDMPVYIADNRALSNAKTGQV